MIGFGLFSKFGALFVTIPEPIIGGIFCIMFGMVTSVGLSNLQFVNLNSTRNLFILGFSIFFGLSLSKWVKSNESKISFYTPGPMLEDELSEETIQVYDTLAQVIRVLLSTSMFVSGFIGFVLDNTIPGTEEERGLTAWKGQHEKEEGDDDAGDPCYDIPVITSYLKKWSWTKKIPFSPTYEGFNLCSRNKIHPN